MVREQGAEAVPFVSELNGTDEWLVVSAQGATDDTVASLVDGMTGRQIREMRARLAAEKVRVERLEHVIQGALGQITDALRARE